MFCNEHILGGKPKASLRVETSVIILSFRIFILSSSFENFCPYELHAEILHVLAQVPPKSKARDNDFRTSSLHLETIPRKVVQRIERRKQEGGKTNLKVYYGSGHQCEQLGCTKRLHLGASQELRRTHCGDPPHPTPHGKKRSIGTEAPGQELSRIVNALMFPGLHMQQNDYMSLFATTASRVKNRDQDDAKWSTRFFPRILLVYCYNQPCEFCPISLPLFLRFKN